MLINLKKYLFKLKYSTQVQEGENL